MVVDQRGRVFGVEQWAEVRRMHRLDGLSARDISRRTGLARDTVARLLASSTPPRYQRRLAGSKLDPSRTGSVSSWLSIVTGGSGSSPMRIRAIDSAER
jgi:hypothetical protein